MCRCGPQYNSLYMKKSNRTSKLNQNMKSLLIVIVFSFAILSATAQDKIAVKTNLLYGAGTFTPNLGVEIGLGERTTLDISGAYNWFNLGGNTKNNKKLVHWLVQPEFRYFLCERFSGHFFGLHAIGSQYNIGGHELPMFFGRSSKNYRHEGNAYGGGLSYGYQLPLAKRWNLEFNVGVGYMRMKYDVYDCTNCGGLKEKGRIKNYFGPTKAGITLIFLIN